MQIAVIGTGYVGLVAGACFAESGNDVTCVDINQSKIDELNNGGIPIYEPGLEEIVKRNIREERLFFTSNLAEAVERSLIIFIAVGTPPSEDGSADLKHVLSAARDIGRAMEQFKIIVLKSTVPVGSAAKVRKAIQDVLQERKQSIEFDVVSNPEFLKEGAAITDFMKPDRVVIGADNVRTAEIMKELYAPFLRTGKPIHIMDNPSAEMTKYVSNALLATKISFMNEMACLCEQIGADIDSVRMAVGSDSRIGYQFLFPGLGYGGSCFPKDVKALVAMGGLANTPMEIINAVESVNQRQKQSLLKKITAHFGDSLKGRTIAVWGLAFKPKTDDMREAPSVVLIEGLLERGAKVAVYDPVAMDNARSFFGDRVEYGKKMYDCLEGADALALATEWDEFRRPNWDVILEKMTGRALFDGRNIYDPSRMRDQGFTYFSIGRQ
ncbi:MAG: UDP-glucose/GDP-mannose dehydrogenase family protein [Candidatus Hinthialibacter antarcticus]|nr:UDP-glucose/GDP-mannose dehydrogenase family protein [Candidatus Hinthialibacter antarcticus]